MQRSECPLFKQCIIEGLPQSGIKIKCTYIYGVSTVRVLLKDSKNVRWCSAVSIIHALPFYFKIIFRGQITQLEALSLILSNVTCAVPLFTFVLECCRPVGGRYSKQWNLPIFSRGSSAYLAVRNIERMCKVPYPLQISIS